MRVLIACEHSGTVREAFRAKGHDAYSCDLLPASDNSENHIQGDVLEWLKGAPKRVTRPVDLMHFAYFYVPDIYQPWDLLIAHPPCTYFTNSAAWAFKEPDYERYPGVGYHQQLKPGTLTGRARHGARWEALAFTLELWNCDIPRICIENPVGHLSQHLGKTQVVQPYQFGDDASKGTALWRKNLPPLVIDPAERKAGRIVIHKGKQVERWSNQTDSGQNRLSPSDDRAHLRAITYSGIANAMAEQWGNL